VAQCVSFANRGRELDVFPSFCALTIQASRPHHTDSPTVFGASRPSVEMRDLGAEPARSESVPVLT
jgi:hypothetical protein